MSTSRKSNKNSNNDLHTILIVYLAMSAIILATVAILFGGIFNHLGISPPQESSSTIEQTATLEPSQTETDTSSTIVVTDPTSDSNESTTSEETTSVQETHGVTSEENTENSDNSVSEDISNNTESETNNESQIPTGTVYLTFDDGPSTKTTSQILDILKEKGVKATFFILDYSYGSEKESLIIREFEEGHTIGLHGISHDYSKIYTSLDALIKNFTDLQEKLKTSTGYTSYIIRFPGGSSNTVSKKYCTGIMSEAVEYFSNSDFVYFDWNIDSRDAGGVNSSQELYNNVVTRIKPGKNNVILMHDSSNKEFTIEALSKIIDFCIAEGYEFKAITQDTPQVTHNVSN